MNGQPTALRRAGALAARDWSRVGGGLHLARIDSARHQYQLAVQGQRGQWAWQGDRWPIGMPQGSRRATIATGQAGSLRGAQRETELAVEVDLKRSSG